MIRQLPPDPRRRRGKRPARRLAQASGLLLAALALAACNSRASDADKSQGGRGGDPAHPTIVSLNPCTDAILARVTGPGQLLAISGYSHDPDSSSMGVEEARRYRAVSGSVEEVTALAPDVVVASSYLPPATMNALRDLGMKVVLQPIVKDADDARRQVRELASLTGHPAMGATLVASIDAALQRDAPPPGWKPVPALVWESGGLVAGDDTLVVDLLKHTGFVNGASARGLRQADFLPLEHVLADPPRVIFAAGNSYAEEDRMLRHPALQDLPDTLRIPLGRSMLWCAGPTVPRLLDTLAAARKSYVAAHTTTKTPPDAGKEPGR